MSRLRHYSLEQIISFVSRLNITLSRVPSSDTERTFRQQQDRILYGCMQASTVDGWRRALAGDSERSPEKDAFFHERQLLTALKLGLLHIEIWQPDGDLDYQLLVEALLMINDLLDLRFENLDLSKPVGRRLLAAYEFASALFYRKSLRPQGHVRALHEFIEPPAAAHGTTLFDIKAGIERVTGLSPLDVYAAILAIQADWQSLSDDDVAEGKVVQSRVGYLSSLTKLSPEEREKWYALGLAELPDLQARVRDRYTQNDNPFDFLEFELTPLVAIGDNVACISLNLLGQLGTQSVYHRLLRAKTFEKDESNLFLSTYGRVVEIYGTALLKRIFGGRCIPEERLLPITDRHKTKVCDAMVDYGDSLLLFEIKGGRVPLAARQAVNGEKMLDTWKQLLPRAVEQLRQVATLARKGAFAEIGIEPASIKRIYPVVVCFDHIALPVTYGRIQAEVLIGTNFAGAVQRGEIERLTIANIGELELCEAAAEQGVNLLDEIRGALTVSRDFVPPISFHLGREGGPQFHGMSTWANKEYERLSTMVRRRCRDLGLPQSEDLPTS